MKVKIFILNSIKDENIGSYLIKQIIGCNVKHVFGVPGDYVLHFFDMLSKSGLQVINTCDEQGAGFMADAYSRMRGLGVVCVTYGVGALKVVNTTAQAFAEKSPVIVISGAPGITEREKFPLYHHRVRDFDSQNKMFEQITVASTILDNPETATKEIDRVFSAALHYKMPVYIELPRDVISSHVIAHNSVSANVMRQDSLALNEAISEAVKMIEGSKKPVIIAGIEMHRLGLQEELVRLAEKYNIPVASTILSKSVINETHPLYLGVYEGAIGNQNAQEYVESSDCLILLGSLLTDVFLDIFPKLIYQGKSIQITTQKLTIQHHSYENVPMKNFVEGLLGSKLEKKPSPQIRHGKKPTLTPIPNKEITVSRLFQRLNLFVNENTIILCDVGECLFGSIDLVLPSGVGYFSPSHYASLGFAVPAGVAAGFAEPKKRPLVIVGDGAFQMTGLELAVAVRYNLNPIVIILNNSGYVTERVMLDGPFNDIPPLNHSLLPNVFGGGKGFIVKTEGELEKALSESQRHASELCIIDVILNPDDRSDAIRRVSSLYASRV